MTPEERAEKKAIAAARVKEKNRDKGVKECLELFSNAPVTKRVLVLWYGLENERQHSRREIARKTESAPMAVSKLIDQAKAKMRRHLGSGAALLHRRGGMFKGIGEPMAKTIEQLLEENAELRVESNNLARKLVVMEGTGKIPTTRTYRHREDEEDDSPSMKEVVLSSDDDLEARRGIIKNDYERALETECKVRREDGVEVPVVLRVPQRRYVQMRSRLREEKGQVKIVEVKCRQYGSTWVKAACFALDLINFPGSRLLIVADDKAKSEHIGRDYVYAVLMSIDERLRPEVSKFTAKQSGECFRLSNGSSCILGTANRAAQLAKSYTMHFGLFTEVATWCLKLGSSQRADEALLAVMQCFPDPTVAPQVAIDMESTAYGQGGLFADTHRKGKKDEDGWTANFSPYFELEKYAVKDEKQGWSEEKENQLAGLRADLDKRVISQLKLDDVELNLVLENDILTWGNILWRRLYGLPKCQGDIYKFQQEYPSNDIEAFQFSGAPVFSPHSINHFEAIAKKRGFYPVEILVKSPTLFEIATVEGRASDFQLYKMPDPTSRYFIGGDVALGSASMYGDDRSMSKKPRNDATVASIWEQETGEQVLEFVGYPDPEEFGDILYQLALIYNRSVVNPERNTFGAATIKRLYGQLRYENVFMYLMESYEGQGRAVPGTPIHVGTRTMVLDKFRVAVKQKVAKPRSLGLLTEMAEVQKNEITGRIDHPRQGSDDRIFAASHAWWAMTESQLRLSGDTSQFEEEGMDNPFGLPVAFVAGQPIGSRSGERRDPIFDPNW